MRTFLLVVCPSIAALPVIAAFLWLLVTEWLRSWKRSRVGTALMTIWLLALTSACAGVILDAGRHL